MQNVEDEAEIVKFNAELTEGDEEDLHLADNEEKANKEILKPNKYFLTFNNKDKDQ